MSYPGKILCTWKCMVSTSPLAAFGLSTSLCRRLCWGLEIDRRNRNSPCSKGPMVRQLCKGVLHCPIYSSVWLRYVFLSGDTAENKMKSCFHWGISGEDLYSNKEIWALRSKITCFKSQSMAEIQPYGPCLRLGVFTPHISLQWIQREGCFSLSSLGAVGRASNSSALTTSWVNTTFS